MKFHRSKFNSLSPPLKIKQDIKTNTWTLVDAENVLIAENLSQDNAVILESSVNTVGKALIYLNMILEHEVCIDHKETREFQSLVKRRKGLLQIIEEFLKEIDILDNSQNYERNIKQWAETLLFPKGRRASVGHLNFDSPHKGDINGKDDEESGADKDGSCEG